MTNKRLLTDPKGEGLKVKNLFGKIERFDIFLYTNGIMQIIPYL